MSDLKHTQNQDFLEWLEKEALPETRGIYAMHTNARLIAAAPEMLQLLKDITRQDIGLFELFEISKKAKEIIKKVEGEDENKLF